MTKILQLSDKDFTAAIIKMLRWTVVDTLETIEKIESLTKEIGNINKDIEDIRKNEMEILELKKCNNWNLKTQWVDSKQNRRDREKNQSTGRYNNRNYLIWTTGSE